MTKIRDLAVACKSKNAGPFHITIDIIFEPDDFEKVRRTGVLGPELFGRLYRVEPSSIIYTEYEPASAFKATFKRTISAGDAGDGDVYGAQQHAPLLDIDLPID